MLNLAPLLCHVRAPGNFAKTGDAGMVRCFALPPNHPVDSPLNNHLVGGWATPLNKKIVNGDDDIPFMYGKIKNGNQTTNQITRLINLPTN